MQRVLFGEEILSSYTKEIYQDGEVILNKIEGTKASIDETIKYSPKLTIERLGNVIEVDLYTNNYRVNGEEKELKTVVPYINGKYFIPQELIDIVSNLKENTNSKDIEEKVEENIVDIIEEVVITDINSEEVNEIQEETAVYNQDTIKEDIEEVGGEN